MAASITPVRVADAYDVWGKTRVQVADCPLDTSYPAGGYSITPASIGFRTILGASVIGSKLATASGYMALWDAVNNKLVIYNPTNTVPSVGPGTQVVATTDLSAASFRLLFYGN